MGAQRIAITGLATPLAQRLVERLLQAEAAPALLGLDVRRPLRQHERLAFCDVDLTDPTVDARLADVLQRERIDTVVHLAFRRFPSSDVDYDHDLETVGSFALLAACAAAKVRRLVVQSSTMAYGAHASNPNFLTESHPLRGHPDAHNVQNRVEVESILADWTRRHPDVQVSVLRHCWVMGPTWFDRVVEFFERSRIPTVLGYDPLLQFVHERDLVDAFERAALEAHPGVFNVVGRGVAPLSTLLALAGKRNVAVPRPVLYRTAWLASQGGTGDPPAGFFDYLRFLWVADGARGWREFGEPIYTTTEAWSAFVGSRRLRRLG
ncbi:MAG: NAD-dependent epimerase/dehydratase family protein [Myxococcota bacterium]